MKCFVEMLRRPGWLALAILAVGAATAEAQQQTRSTASRHAARQVRLPAETKPAAPQAKVASKTIQDRAVQQAAHAVPVTSRPAASRTTGAQTYRTTTRTASRHPTSVLVQEGEVMMDESMSMHEMLPPPGGEIVMEEGGAVVRYPHEHAGSFGGDACCGDGCDDCGNCGKCTTCCLLPCPKIRLDNFEFFGGVQGFTGPLTRGEGGSFGFHEGVNWANSLPCFSPDFLTAQVGAMATQSNFAGSSITDQDRRQFFVTAGAFRRADWGLQGGMVVDFLHDEWFYEPVNLTQIRGELSWVFNCDHELGFWFTQGLTNTTATSEIRTSQTTFTTVTEGWHPTDLYAFFYRHQFDDCNTSGRIFAGFTDNADGLVGADFQMPLSERWALRSEFTYLVPTEGKSFGGNAEEGWNVGISLVWYPGCRTARNHDYNRPLFNVANNGSFMVDRD